MNDTDLRTTFDRVATAYHAARPDYPPELFEDLVVLTGVTPPARLLEVGCGTGKATIPLARAGFETFSGHIAMAPRKRERLYGDIRALIAERPHATIERHWSAVLTVGRRR